jgi:MFS family permease
MGVRQSKQLSGLAVSLVPLVLFILNLVYVGSAYPLGALSDRFNRQVLLAAGFGMLIAADLVLAVGTNLVTILVGVGLWGLHLGMTQGLLAALVADAAPAALRGSTFGVSHLVTGLATLLASLSAGSLWAAIDPAAIFLGGSGLHDDRPRGLVALMRRPPR